MSKSLFSCLNDDACNSHGTVSFYTVVFKQNHFTEYSEIFAVFHATLILKESQGFELSVLYCNDEMQLLDRLINKYSLSLKMSENQQQNTTTKC